MMRTSFQHLAAICAALALSACGGGTADPGTGMRAPLPAVAPEPALPGPLAVDARDYALGRIAVHDEQTGEGYETDVRGVVHFPGEAAGPFPVLLFMHGRHQTCETGPGQLPVPVGDDNCPPLAPVLAPAQSYRGYDYLAARLASHGYVVISIDANDINDNDGSASGGDAGALARGELVLHHLDAFRTIAAQGGSGLEALQNRLDFSRVGLMGHSRGGEGVAKAAILNAARSAPHALKAVFALAPTDYNGQQLPGDVSFATLLPYCDGDVENLMGAFVYDAARAQARAPRFQILAMGANHNYYNTVWTSDDWTIHGSPSEPHCGEAAASSMRDTPELQRAHGQFFMAAFFRAFVGGEPEHQAYWSGRSAVPASACPPDAAACETRYHLSIEPGIARRLLIDAMPPEGALSHNALGLPVRLDGFSAAVPCTAAGADGSGCDTALPTFSTAEQLALSWDAPAVYASELGGIDARAYDTLGLRIGAAHGDTDNGMGQDFTLVLVDASGTSAAQPAGAHSHALFDPPGAAFDSGGAEKTTLNQVRIPLAAFAGVDLAELSRIELHFDRRPAGTVQLTDLMLMEALP